MPWCWHSWSRPIAGPGVGQGIPGSFGETPSTISTNPKPPVSNGDFNTVLRCLVGFPAGEPGRREGWSVLSIPPGSFCIPAEVYPRFLWEERFWCFLKTTEATILADLTHVPMISFRPQRLDRQGEEGTAAEVGLWAPLGSSLPDNVLPTPVTQKAGASTFSVSSPVRAC